jgi:hypothetical protein
MNKHTPKFKMTTVIAFSAKAKSRMLKLAKLLRQDAKRKKGIQFDMHTFGRVNDKENLLSCGTRACALGLAALSEEFKRDGLGYRINGGQIDITYKGKDMTEYETGARVFDIPVPVAEWLFGGHASLYDEGAEAELEMADILENAADGQLPTEAIAALQEAGYGDD